MDLFSAEKILSAVYEKKPFQTRMALKVESADLMFDVTFIIPMFNASSTITRCLDSIVNQSTTDYSYEIVLVDDGSTDNTVELVEEYIEKTDCTIKVVEQENGGIGAARNTGLGYAQGRFIAFVDNDDYIMSDYIETLMRIADKTGAEVIKCSRIEEKDDSRKIVKYKEINIDSIGEHIGDYRGYIWEGIVARRIFEQVGFPENYWYEDMVTKTLVYRMAKGFVCINTPLYVHTFGEKNASKIVWSGAEFKSLDQLFLFDELMNESKRLGIEDKKALSKLIVKEWCGRLFYSRTRKLPIRVKKASMCVRANRIRDIDIDYSVLDRKERFLLVCVKDERYYLWSAINYLSHVYERYANRTRWITK